MKKDFEYFIKKANRDIQYCEEKGYGELKEYVASLLSHNDELEKENKILEELNVCVGCNNNPNYKSRIDKAIEYMKHYIKVEDAPINERIKIEFEELLKILKGEENE